jgi:hypothetical protein
MHTILWRKNLNGGDHAEDLGVDGKLVQERSFGKRLGMCGLNSHGAG